MVSARLQEVLLFIAEETQVHQCANELGEPLVAESSTDNGVSIEEVVACLVWSRVAVGVGDECVTWVDEVWLGGSHKLWARHIDDVPVLVELGCVAKSEENAATAPRELVAEWVVAVLRRWETSAVAEEACDLAARLVDLINGFDSIEMVDTRVKTDLVHDGDASLLRLSIQLHHGWRDV